MACGIAHREQRDSGVWRDVRWPFDLCPRGGLRRLTSPRLGSALQSYTVDKGLAGGAPGAPATYVAMCHLFCDSVEAFQAGFGPHAKAIMADVPNYTDIAPVVQISEVVVR